MQTVRCWREWGRLAAWKRGRNWAIIKQILAMYMGLCVCCRWIRDERHRALSSVRGQLEWVALPAYTPHPPVRLAPLFTPTRHPLLANVLLSNVLLAHAGERERAENDGECTRKMGVRMVLQTAVETAFNVV